MPREVPKLLLLAHATSAYAIDAAVCHANTRLPLLLYADAMMLLLLYALRHHMLLSLIFAVTIASCRLPR